MSDEVSDEVSEEVTEHELRLRFIRLEHSNVVAESRRLAKELGELHERGKFTDRRAVARRASIKERLGDLDERAERLEGKFQDAK